MDTIWTDEKIPFDKLVLHPANVRSKSPDAYTLENIADIMATLPQMGLIHPLAVQKLDGKWGILAGGRRFAALTALVGDKAQKTFTKKMTIDCRVLPEDCDATTAISLAENITQADMSPIDQYEAYARMIEIDGQGVEDIAKTFGTTTAAVKGRLRYGLVHQDIRDAVRAKDITIDVMKAFADHPSQDVQLEVFKMVMNDDMHVSSYTIRNMLKSRGLQVSDDLGAFVLDAYKDQNGAVAEDLLVENSVLTDMELVEAVLLNKLHDAAEMKRKRLGFAWADADTTHDHTEMAKFGRVYTSPLDLDEKTQSKVDKLNAEIEALEAKRDAEDVSDDDWDALNAQIEALSETSDELSYGYSEEDLARAGVMATWLNGDVHFSVGLVRPEDEKSAAAKSEATGAADIPNDELVYSQGLSSDLQTERAMALGLALAEHPELATDLTLFKLVTDVVTTGMSVTHGVDIRASVAHRSHDRMDEIDQTSGVRMNEIFEALDLTWCVETLSPAEQFPAFRQLPAKDKQALVAYATALTVKSNFASCETRDSLMNAVEAEALPDLRAHWTPNAAFFGRIQGKPKLLRIISDDLGLPNEALNLTSAKKADIVAFLDKLFAEPFATLTEDQQNAVAAWCPPHMQTLPAPAQKVVAMKGKAKRKKAA